MERGEVAWLLSLIACPLSSLQAPLCASIASSCLKMAKGEEKATANQHRLGAASRFCWVIQL